MPLLEVENLEVEFVLPGRRHHPVLHSASLAVEAGSTLGIVGESGSGKSMLLRAIMQVMPPRARITSGRISYDGGDITHPSKSTLARVRGREIAMILQDPMTALNPVLTVGQQILETLKATRRLTGDPARDRARQLLRMVEIPDPERVLRAYPYQLSGGLAQRVSIAIAISAEPKILLADEPTTALDVTVQAQILRLLSDLRDNLQMALVLVSHDMAVVAQACARVAVMYAGSFVESGPSTVMFDGPRHPYTVGLLGSIPRIDAGTKAEALRAIPGAPPALGQFPPGCKFEPRCPLATDECGQSPVPLTRIAADHEAACLHHDLVAANGVRFAPAASGAARGTSGENTGETTLGPALRTAE
jgi:oligopeptide/dipeptide ABC transporter ATP-binding protein